MLIGPLLVVAQGSADPGPQRNGQVGGAIVSPLDPKVTSTAQVLGAFFKVLIQVGAVAVTLAIVYAGFLFVVARGNPEELNKAKRTLMWTIIGALVLLGSQIIAKVIENTIKTIGS